MAVCSLLVIADIEKECTTSSNLVPNDGKNFGIIKAQAGHKT
jgi:hypothetical protein